MDVKSMLLGFLMKGSMTGYELKKIFSISFSFFSGLSYGSIYPALRKMENEGLITMRMEIQDGAPNRKVCTITEAGRETFMEAMRAPFSMDKAKSPFLAKLFFFAHLSPEERVAMTTSHLEAIKEVHGHLEVARLEIEARADRFQYLCFEFGMRFFDDLARNVSEVLRELQEDQDAIGSS
jgi:DNA-binding PadR family transcriptional regulator